MPKFAIGIPTLNRADLLLPTLEKYSKDFPDVPIIVIDNGNQPELEAHKLHSRFVCKENLGVAASWNALCEMIFMNYDWALLLNDDIYCGYTTEVVNAAIERSKVGIVQSALNFSVLLISEELYKKVGKFDEKFYPAYFEDSDYLYRLKLMGIRQEIDYSLNPVDVKISQTYEKNPELVNKAMVDNKARYIEKWGGLPLLEQFKIPYNTTI